MIPNNIIIVASHSVICWISMQLQFFSMHGQKSSVHYKISQLGANVFRFKSIIIPALRLSFMHANFMTA